MVQTRHFSSPVLKSWPEMKQPPGSALPHPVMPCTISPFTMKGVDVDWWSIRGADQIRAGAVGEHLPSYATVPRPEEHPQRDARPGEVIERGRVDDVCQLEPIALAPALFGQGLEPLECGAHHDVGRGRLRVRRGAGYT